jgi:hypothetical protein
MSSIWPEGVSSTLIKVKIAKDMYLQMRKLFGISCQKRFAVKINLQTLIYGLASM